MRRLARLGLAIVTFSGVLGCETARQPLAVQTVTETRWLLIRNPSVGDVRTEPEYVWVEEDKVPLTLTTLMRRNFAIMAPPEVVAKHGPPPGEGKISPRQLGVPIIHPVTGEILGVLEGDR